MITRTALVRQVVSAEFRIFLSPPMPVLPDMVGLVQGASVRGS